MDNQNAEELMRQYCAILIYLCNARIGSARVIGAQGTVVVDLDNNIDNIGSVQSHVEFQHSEFSIDQVNFSNEQVNMKVSTYILNDTT